MAAIHWVPEANGDWLTRADWSTGALPGGTDDVVLSTLGAFTITHSSGVNAAGSITATTDQLTVSGGSLRVFGTASLQAGLLLSGGTLALAGGGSIAGGLVANGGTLSLGGGTVTAVTQAADLGDGASLTGGGTLATAGLTSVGTDGSTLVIGGGVTWSNAGTATLGGSVQFGGAAHLVNLAGAQFVLAADAAGVIGAGGAETFGNAGTLTKSAGSGSSEIDATLSSTGAIVVQIGTLLLTSGGALAGTLDGAGTLELGASSVTRLGSLTGNGTLLSTGLLTLAASSVTMDAALLQQGGTLGLGGGATLTVTGSLALQGGVLVNGASTLATSGAVSVAADGMAVTLRGPDWENAGSVSVGGSILIGNATVFDNLAGARFALTGAGAGIISAGANSSFANAGVLDKTQAAGTSEIDSTLTSTGTINVGAGTLLLTSGGTLGGTLDGVGTLDLGTASATKLASLTGNGLLLSSGVLTLAGAVVTVDVDLVQQGGTLGIGGGATLTTTGSLSLQGGAVINGVSTLATDGATSVGADGIAVTLRGPAWINAGTVTVGAALLIASPTSFDNLSGARFVLTADGTGIISSAANSTFDNAGVLSKSAGTGTSEIDSVVTSTGTINAAVGTLLLTGNALLGGSVSGAGTLELAGGVNQILNLTAGSASSLVLASGIGAALTGSTLGALSLNQGQLVASGYDRITEAFAQTGGRVFVATASTLELDGSVAILGGGTLSGLGSLVTTAASTLGADGVAIGVVNLAWSNGGGLVVDGVLDSAGSVQFTNTAGGSFGLANDAAGIVDLAGVSTFLNAGSLAKLGGTGSSRIDSVLTSTGTVSVASGTLQLDGGGSLGGLVAGAGTLLFAGGTFSVAAGTTLTVAAIGVSAGKVSIAAALGAALSLSGGGLDLLAAGRSTVASLAFSGGGLTLEAGGTLLVSGAASLAASGTLSGAGKLITAGVTSVDGLTLATGATWGNRGTTTVSAAVQCGTRDVLNNTAIASLALAGDAAGIFGSGMLGNAGSLNKTSGSGTSTIDLALTSTGTVSVLTGTLDLAGGGSLGGSLRGAGTLLFGGGSFAVAGSTALTVANLAVSAGSVSLGDATTAGRFVVSGGFSLGGGSLLLANGGLLTLDGAAVLAGSGTIGGGGTLSTSAATSVAADGSTITLGSGLLWANAGTVTALGEIASGSGLAGVTIDNAAAGVVDLGADAAGIIDNGSVSTFVNAGTLAKTAGQGTSRLFTSLASTGTLLADSGTLALEFSATLSGTAGGSGGGRLLLVNGASSSGQLSITDNGTAASVQIAGGFVSWSNSGSVADSGIVLLGDGSGSGPAILYNAAGATWSFLGPDAGLTARGQAWFTNAGTLQGSAGGGSANVGFDFTNTGLIDVASGTLVLQGTVTGSGAMQIEAGATLELGQTLDGGQTLGFAGTGSTLRLDQPASIAAPLQGFGLGDSIDFAAASITAASVAGDVLSVVAGGTDSFVSSQSLDGFSVQITADGRGGSLVTLGLGTAGATQHAGSMMLPASR